MEAKVFFTWSYESKHSAYLKKHLREACDKSGFKYVQTGEGTSGSYPIVADIFAKIDQCDVYVCDLTPIVQFDDGKYDPFFAVMRTRAHTFIVVVFRWFSLSFCLFIFRDKKVKQIPAPNVMLELGYAMAKLPLECIIMLLPDNVDIPQLPFDIAGNRISTFDEKNKKNLPIGEWIKASVDFGINQAKPDLIKIFEKIVGLDHSVCPDPVTTSILYINFPKRGLNLIQKYKKKYEKYVIVDIQDRNNTMSEPVVNLVFTSVDQRNKHPVDQLDTLQYFILKNGTNSFS